MGGSSWSSVGYDTRAAIRMSTGSSGFDYHDKIKNVPKAEQKVHPDLDPKNIKGFRESRDSAAHPESLPIVVCFDETGSMNEHPRNLQKELGKIMGFLLNSGGIEHPQVCFAAVGDCRPAEAEVAPFQVGQFESGLEMDDHLGKIFLEGKGGGQSEESYDLFFYFLARKTSCDAFEKRGKKGYAFIICDENIRKTVSRNDIYRVFGDNIESDIPIQDIINEALEKWEVFAIKFPYRAVDTTKEWKKILGERVIETSNSSEVCGLIAGTIAANEGASINTVVDNLKKSGLNINPNAIVVREKQETVALATTSGGNRKRL